MYINCTGNHNLDIGEEWHYLSPYEMSFEEAATVENINTISEEFPYDELDPDKLESIADSVYDELWESISGFLNDYNKVKCGQDFWKFYSSYDFYFFIMMYYERYVEISKIKRGKTNAVFLLRKPSDDYLISKMLNRNSIGNNYDNIVGVIDWQIIKCLNLNYKILGTIDFEIIENNGSLISRLRNCLIWMLNFASILFVKNNSVIVTGIRPVRTIRRKLLKKYHRRLSFVYHCCPPGRNVDLDIKIRDKICGYFNSVDSEFKNIFFNHLCFNLPVWCMESFHDYWKANYFKYKKGLKCLIASSMDEFSMIQKARIYDEGGLYVDVHHCFESSFRTKLAAKIYDYTYIELVWSNRKLFFGDKCRYIGENRLKDINKVDYKINDDILFVEGSFLEKYTRCTYNACIKKDRTLVSDVRKTIDFIENLDDKYKNYLWYRVRDDEWKRGIYEYLVRHYDSINVEKISYTGQRSLINRLKNSRIVICEAVYTTSFFESILSGVPTLIIDGGEIKEFVSSPLYTIYQDMIEQNIVVENGFDAARIINENYECIDEWWNEPKRKKVVDELCSLTRDDELKMNFQWLDDLIGEVINSFDQ